MNFKTKNAIMIFFLFIIISSFVIGSKIKNSINNNQIHELSLKDSIVETVDTIQIPDTTKIYNEETKSLNKYIKVIKYEITEYTQEESFVFTKGREYIIGTNSDDIFIYFSKQVNTESNKNMKIKFIENGKAITYVCKETEVHHLKFRIVSSKDKKDPYEATVYFVVP